MGIFVSGCSWISIKLALWVLSQSSQIMTKNILNCKYYMYHIYDSHIWKIARAEKGETRLFPILINHPWRTNSKQYSKAIWSVFISDSKLRWDLDYKIRDKIGAISNYMAGKPMSSETLLLHKIFVVCLSFRDLERQQLTKWAWPLVSCRCHSRARDR